jgi:hypothetical protein
MIGITLTTDQIRTAPAQVRQWIEHQVIASLGLSGEQPVTEQPQTHHLGICSDDEAAAVLAQIQGSLPAVNVFFEFGRPGISYGRPPMMAFRLIDILHHTRLQNVGQVITCLDAINQALAVVRHEANARFCVFDHEGHCFIAPETQQSILRLWQGMLASRQAASNVASASPATLAPAAQNENGAVAPAFMPVGYVKTAEPVED